MLISNGKPDTARRGRRAGESNNKPVPEAGCKDTHVTAVGTKEDCQLICRIKKDIRILKSKCIHGRFKKILRVGGT